MTSKFYYFGFGSNLLAKRIHIQNPTAVRIGPGKLEDYQLDFFTSSRTWLGAPATIVPKKGSCVYGAIWQIDNSNLKDLDDQEGVSHGIYVPITVSVVALSDCKPIECRAYHLTTQPTGDVRSIKDEEIPYDRQPSKTYLKTILKGAVETRLPSDYVQWLRTIKHNGKMVEVLEKKLELYAVEL
ncbi:PREDICTED: gamma-glutamylcyclotransferase-like [Rhagoletis zephyria]|uniref:gamma-glutamylcyclotransferase-like n=1 Tax=Rhagoletis zephyria TaxID=28612 RepID=UPI0008117C18|nr:PREDICTED: gamma-glutamylcyclotransferase-like [Rhagoletis zephyria]